MVYDVIIIGLGASGISASIYAKRSGLNVAVVSFSTPGGIISESSVVENYPGFKRISGMDLAINFFDHFNSMDIPLFSEEVLSIKDGEIKEVHTINNKYLAKSIIICSGRKPKRLDVTNAEKYDGRGISYCAVCDGNLYKDKDVIVVGGGNSALESALYLSNICKNVYVLVRKDKVIADNKLLNDAIQSDNIKIEYNTYIEEIKEDNNVLVGVKTNNGDISAEGIFINIGYEPSTKLFDGLNIKMDKGYVLVDKNMQTNIKGIYACGDIIKKDLYQLVTAVSEGAIAATHLSKSIKK